MTTKQQTADVDLLKRLFGTATPVALVTGSGAKRVGQTIAFRLAKAGFTIAIHANSNRDEADRAVKQIVDDGGKAAAFSADLTEEPACNTLVEEVVKKLGRIDVLVNSAAIWKPLPLEEVTADDVRKNFDLNTLATFLLCKAAGLKMVAQESGGAIVNIGDWAIARPYLNYAAYFPSKGAIPTLTRNFAIELSSRNPRVRVNAVMPGPVMLPQEMPEAERQHAIEGTLVKREGTPEHVADAVHFLICNDFVTGVCLPVDGGRTICAQE